MIIKVNYKGRLGNRLFQFSLGKIISEKLGAELQAKEIEGFSGTKGYKENKKGKFKEIILKDNNFDLEKIETFKECKVILDGFFQNYNFYKSYKQEIKKWLEIENYALSPKTLIVHFRLGDYIKERLAIDYSYYSRAMEFFDVNEIFICSDDLEHKHCIKFIEEFGATPFRGTVMETFRLIKSSNNIISSNSTFSWWASFLSSANKIVQPILLKRMKRANLIVDDENYIYLPAFEISE